MQLMRRCTPPSQARGVQAAAMASLEYALGHCHPQAASNRRAILFYLIPLGMLHSRLPSPHLLAEVAFPSYTTITQVS